MLQLKQYRVGSTRPYLGFNGNRWGKVPEVTSGNYKASQGHVGSAQRATGALMLALTHIKISWPLYQ